MKLAKLLGVAMGYLVCVAQPVWSVCKPPGCVDPLAPVFDPEKWTVVQGAFVNLGRQHPDARVELLKSIDTSGQDGVELVTTMCVSQ